MNRRTFFVGCTVLVGVSGCLDTLSDNEGGSDEVSGEVQPDDDRRTSLPNNTVRRRRRNLTAFGIRTKTMSWCTGTQMSLRYE